MTRKRITKSAKPKRDAQIYLEFTEAKAIYPAWCWESLVEMVANKFKVGRSTVYQAVKNYSKVQTKPNP